MIVAIAFLLMSCQNKPDSSVFLSEIDSLSIVLEEGAEKYEQIDTAQLNQNLILISDQLEEMRSDGNNEKSKYLISCQIVETGFNQVIKTYSDIHFELAFSRSQLVNLKSDIEKNILNREIATMYVEQEKKSIHILKLKMDYYNNLYNSSLNNFKLIKTSISKP